MAEYALKEEEIEPIIRFNALRVFNKNYLKNRDENFLKSTFV